MHSNGKLGDFWEIYLHFEAEAHFQQLSHIIYELVSGVTCFCPKHQKVFLKFQRLGIAWLMRDMIWFENSKDKNEKLNK